MEPYEKLYEDLKASGKVTGLPKTAKEFRDKLATDDDALYKTLGAINKLNWDEGQYGLKAGTDNIDVVRQGLGLKKKVVSQPSIPLSPDSGTPKLKSFGETGREELDKPKHITPVKPTPEPITLREIGKVFPETKPDAEPKPFVIDTGIKPLPSKTDKYSDYLKTRVDLRPVMEERERLRDKVFQDLQNNKDLFIDKGRWVTTEEGKRLWVGGRKAKRPELDTYPDEYYQEVDMPKMMEYLKAKYPDETSRYNSGIDAARQDFLNTFYSQRELTPYKNLASQAARQEFLQKTGKPDPATLNTFVQNKVQSAYKESEKQAEIINYRQDAVSKNINETYLKAAGQVNANYENLVQQKQSELIKKYQDAVRKGVMTKQQAQAQMASEYEQIVGEVNKQLKAESEKIYKDYTETLAKANRDIQKEYTDKVEMPFEIAKANAIRETENFYTEEDKKLLRKLYGEQFAGAGKKLAAQQKRQYEAKDLGNKTRDMFQAGVADLMKITGGILASSTPSKNPEMDSYIRAIGERMQNQGMKFEQTQEALAQDPDAVWATAVRSLPITVSAIVPSLVVDAAITAVSKNYATAGLLTKSIVKGVIMRTIESSQEAQSAYDDALAKGMTITQAKEVKAKVYEDNQNLMGLDVLKFMIAGGLVSKTFGKALSGMPVMATYAIERAIDMPVEAFEEIYQGYSQAKAENKDLSFAEYAMSPEGRMAGTTGAIYGLAFGTVGDAIRVVQGADKAIETSSLLKMAKVNFGQNRISQLQSMATMMYQQGGLTTQQYDRIQKKLNLIFAQYETLPEGLHESAKAAVLENLYQMEELREKQQKALDAGSVDLAEAIGEDIKSLKQEIPGILNGKEALYSINGVPFGKEVFGRITAQQGFMDELKQGISDGSIAFWTTDDKFLEKLKQYKPQSVKALIGEIDAEQQRKQPTSPQLQAPQQVVAPPPPDEEEEALVQSQPVKVQDLPVQVKQQLQELGYPDEYEFESSEKAVDVAFGTGEKYEDVKPQTPEGENKISTQSLNNEKVENKETPKALSSVEETAKALEGKDISNIKIDTKKAIPTDTPNEVSSFPLLKGIDVVRYIPESVAQKAWEVWDKEYQTGQSLQRAKERGGFGINEMDMFYPQWRTEIPEYKQAISEAYHKAKADGSNPELVKAVEELLTPKIEQDAKEQQSRSVRTEGKRDQTQRTGDSNMPEVNGTELQNREEEVTAKPEAEEEGKQTPQRDEKDNEEGREKGRQELLSTEEGTKEAPPASEGPVKELKKRAKKKIKDKNRLKLLDIKGVPPIDQVKQYFMRGGRVSKAALESFFKGSKEEVDSRFQLYGGNLTIDKLSEALWEDQDVPGRYDDTEFKSAIEEVILAHVSAKTMQEEMMDKYFPEMPEQEREEASNDLEAEAIAEAIVEDMSEEDAAELLSMLDNQYGTDMVSLENDLKAGMVFTNLQDVWVRFVENRTEKEQAQVEKAITQYIYGNQEQGKAKGKAKKPTETSEKIQPESKPRKPRKETGRGKEVDDLLDDLGDILSEPEPMYMEATPSYGLFGGESQGKSDIRKEFESEKKRMATEIRTMQSQMEAKRKELIDRGATAKDIARIIDPMQKAISTAQQKFVDFERKGEESVRQAQRQQVGLFDTAVDTNLGEIRFQSTGVIPKREDVVYMERVVGDRAELLEGGVEIRSSADVAYLLRHMRDFESENVYVVMHKADGDYEVMYHSTGSTSSAIIDIKKIVAAAVDSGAISVTLVHNHPSGNLKPSNPDYFMHSNLTAALEPFGIGVNESVIIDTDKGLYTTFNKDNYESYPELGEVKGTKQVQVKQFQKQVLYIPSDERPVIRSSKDTAEFLSKQKAGTTPAIAVIVLDRSLTVNGFFLLDESATDNDIYKLAAYQGGKRGEGVIIASNRPLGQKNIEFLGDRLKKVGIDIYDAISYDIGQEAIDRYISFADEGYRLNEPSRNYATPIQSFASKWNVNVYGYFPNTFSDVKSATRELDKIGPEFGIKKAQTGAYYLTRNGKLYRPDTKQQQMVREPMTRIPADVLSKAQDVLAKLYDKGIKEFPEIVELLTSRLGEDALNNPIQGTEATFLDGLKAAYGMMSAFYDDLTPLNKVRTYKSNKNDTDTNTSPESDISGLRPEDGMGEENVWPEQGRVRQGNNPTVSDTDEKGKRPDGSIEPITSMAVVERERGTSGVPTGQPELFGGVSGGTKQGGSRVRSKTGEQPKSEPRQGTDKFVDRDGSESQYATKLEQQKLADSIPVKVGDAANAAETLPFLLDSQIEDIVKAEKRLEVDGEKAILFANGTGTGKGLMSLGIVKRYVRQGKGDIVIVVPKQELIDKAIEEGKLIGLEVNRLDSTSVAGQGVTITTYANLRNNEGLQMRVPDLIVFDESQNILENQEGEISSTTQAARKLFSYKGYWGELKAAERLLGPRPDGNEDMLGYKNWMQAFQSRQEEFKQMAEENYNKSKVVLLSATPFSGEKALIYTDGLLNDMTDANSFYIQNFGYRIRYSKLTKPESDVNQSLMQVTFTDRQIQQGKQSVRMIDVPYDYSRDFLLLESGSGNMIDLGLRLLSDEYKLGDLVRKAHKGIYYTRLLEQLKAKLIVPVVKDLVAKGYKVVVFHDYNKTEGVPHPFQILKQYVTNEKEKEQLKRFEEDHPEFMDLPLSDLQGVITAFENNMGEQSVFLNGENPTKDAVKLFNEDESGKDVLVVSSSKGNAGFSMHDTKGNKPRVLINIGLPVRPIFAIQTEGRIYRVGQASNAAFIYPVIGTGFEKYKFSKIGERTSATENLALGSIARNLKDIFIQGYIQAGTEIDFNTLGTGSKDADKGKLQIDTWELAKSLYYGQQKKNSRTKSQEGEDYYATPEPIGLKMVELLDLKPGQKFLEPSAGHGAIARWIPEYMDATAIEPSYVLRPMLQLNAPQIKRVDGYDFMAFPTVNKYNGIAMNPPFGTAGKTAAEHVKKAFDHLRVGGRLVAIVPNGRSMERIMTWLQDTPDAVLRQEIRLPQVTFGRAGTQVSTTMVVIDRLPEKGASEIPKPPVYSLDLSGIQDINELFDEVKEIGVLEKMGAETMQDQRETAEYLYDKSIDFEKGERTGKDGKTYYTAKPKDRIDDRFKSVATIANNNNGWWGKFSKSFEFKTELDRESFINGVSSMDDTILSEQPGTYEYYDKKAQQEEEKLRQAIRNSIKDLSANPFASAAAVVSQATKYLAYKILAGVKSLSKALAGVGLVPNDFFRKIWDSLRALRERLYKQPPVPIQTPLRGYGLVLNQLPEFKQALNRIYDNQQYKSDMNFLLAQEILAYNTLIQTARDAKAKQRLQTIRDALQVLQANTLPMSAEQTIKYVNNLREAQVEKPVLFDYNPTAFASFMMEMFDTLYPQKVVQRQIEKAGGNIAQGRDPYTLSELYESKVAAKQQEFNERVIKSRRTATGQIPNPSLLERMVADGIDLGLEKYDANTPIGRFLENFVRNVSGSAYLKFLTGQQPIPTFPEYLHAIHAKERNKVVRERRQVAFDEEMARLNAEYALTQSPKVLDDIEKLAAGKNPDFPLIDDTGSGMSDSDADAVINELTNNWPEYLQKYEKYRLEFVSEVVEPIQKELIASGLVSQETMLEWNQDMPNWVHLPVDYYSDEIGDGGKGIKNRTPIKTITGSMKERVNPLLATILYYNKVLKSAEINTVKRDLLGIIKSYPNEDLWRVMRPYMKTVFDPISGQYVQVSSGPQPPNAIAVMNNGSTSWIIINDPQLRRAWEQYGIVENKNVVMRMFSIANQLLYLTAIKLNQDFMVANLVRDIQTALLNVGSDVDVRGVKRNIALMWIPSIRAMYKATRGVPATSQVDKYAYEFMEDGGMMSWADVTPGSLDKKIKKINDELLAAERYIGTPRYGQAVKNILPYLWDVFGDTQAALENAARLATYIASRKAGLSREKAAAVSKNVTVNFHKRGAKAGWLNSVYWLFNASAQSIARTLSGLARSNRLKVAAGILWGSSTILSIINLSRNPNAVMAMNEHMKATGVFFIGPEGDMTYRKLPIAYFWNTFKYAGDVTAQVLTGNMEPSQGAKHLWIEALSSVNPLGYAEDEKAFLENMVPTIARTPLQVAYNRTFYGKMVYPESEFGWNLKDSEKYWDETNPDLIEFTKWLSEVSGGDSRKNEGFLEISPAAMEYIMKTYLGGPYRTAAGVRKFSQDLETKDFNWDKYPITRVFSGRIASNSIRNGIVEIIDKGQTNPITQQDVNKFNNLVKMRIIQISVNYSNDPINAQKQLKNLKGQISRFSKLRTLDMASEIFRDKNLQELNDLISR